MVLGKLPTTWHSAWQAVRGSGIPSGPLHIPPRINKKDENFLEKLKENVKIIKTIEMDEGLPLFSVYN